MKHYSEIIKKAIVENNDKCAPKNTNPNSKDNMNSMAFILQDSEPNGIEIMVLKSRILFNVTKGEISKIHSKTSMYLILGVKLIIRIVRFTNFLLKIIMNSGIQLNLKNLLK